MSVLDGLLLVDNFDQVGWSDSTNLSDNPGSTNWADCTGYSGTCQYWADMMEASSTDLCTAFNVQDTTANDRVSVLKSMNAGQSPFQYEWMLWLRVSDTDLANPNGYVAVGYPDGNGQQIVEIWWSAFTADPGGWSQIDNFVASWTVGDRLSFDIDEFQHLQFWINEDVVWDGFDFNVTANGLNGFGVQNFQSALDDYYAGEPAGYSSDDFNRANETPLGYPWLKQGGGDLNLVSNGVTKAASDDALWYRVGSTSSADQFAEASESSAVTSHDWGPAVRLGGAGHSNLEGYFFEMYAGQPTLAKFVNGAFTQIAVSGSIAYSVGDVLRIEAIGTSIKGYLNGTVVISTTDSSITGAGNGAGLFAYETGGSIDNWAGGNVGSGGPSRLTTGWTTGYKLRQRNTPTWQTSYKLRKRNTTAWATSYKLRKRNTTAWATSYALKGRVTAAWLSAYRKLIRPSATTWQTSYKLRQRNTPTWQTSYKLRQRNTPTWQTSYHTLVRPSATTWQTSYKLRQRNTTAWATSYNVSSSTRSSTAWTTSYKLRQRNTTAWATSYRLLNRSSTSWATSYKLKQRSTPTWTTSYALRARNTSTWQTSYKLRQRNIPTWATSYVLRKRNTTAWVSSFGTRAATTWQSGYVVRTRTTVNWLSRYGVGGRSTQSWATSYKLRKRFAFDWQTSYNVFFLTAPPIIVLPTSVTFVDYHSSAGLADMLAFVVLHDDSSSVELAPHTATVEID